MDDKYQEYSKKVNHYSSQQNDDYNENSQNKPFERDSLTINEQKVAKLNKIFNDALAEFTTPSDLEDYNMIARESSSLQTRDKYSTNEYITNPYKKHYQPVDASYNKYLYSKNSIIDRHPSQPEFYETSYADKSSAEQLSPKSYAAYQKHYERLKQQNE